MKRFHISPLNLLPTNHQNTRQKNHYNTKKNREKPKIVIEPRIVEYAGAALVDDAGPGIDGEVNSRTVARASRGNRSYAAGNRRVSGLRQTEGN